MPLPKGPEKRNTEIIARIREVVAAGHPSGEWLVLDEFPLETGRGTGAPRIDVLAIKMKKRGRCEPLTRVAYEIKTNRRDYFDELRNPTKRERAYKIANEYWFAAPEKLLRFEEIPPECGLLTVMPGLSCGCVTKGAPELYPEAPSVDLMLDVARRAYHIGRRDGARTCAFERFDMLMELSHMLIESRASAETRKSAVLKMANALRRMQRHAESEALAEIAYGGGPTDVWYVSRALQSGRRKADSV